VAIERQVVEAALGVLAALVPEWTPGAGLNDSAGAKVVL
jgi:hypothetical protein